MQNKSIPSGLELVTDPNITKLFSCKADLSDRQLAFLFVATPKVTIKRPDNTAATLRAMYRYKRKQRERVFADDGTVNAQPGCSWGTSRLSRFISRYVHFYKQKPSENRTFILEQLISIAKENNIVLPQPSEMNSRRPKKQFIVEAVGATRYCDVMKLKVYYDGENLVGYLPGENKPGSYERRERTHWDDLFDKHYAELKVLPENNEHNQKSEVKQQIRTRIECELIRLFYEVYGYDDNTADEPCALFISRKIWNLSASFKERQKRFFRKKDQIRWTAWVTITYDDKKFSNEEVFRKVLKTYFKNKSHLDRGNWRVMGKFEYGEENGRLHFHGFFYIPTGTDSRTLVNRSKWSDKRNSWHNYKADTELLEKFGDNEYEDITEATHSDINAMAKYTDKMTRYMDKGEKVFYSRHIPTEFEISVMGKEICTGYRIVHKREIKRYVLMDSAFVRSDTGITRKTDVYSAQAYDIGLLDDDKEIA